MGKGWGILFQKIQEIQKNLERIKEELTEKKVEATSGGGVVKAVVDGNQNLVSLKIDKEVLEMGDVEMLEGLIIAAVNEAMRKAREIWMEELTKLTGGLPIPPLF